MFFPTRADHTAHFHHSHKTFTAQLYRKLSGIGRLGRFPQFHNLHHNNKGQKPFQVHNFKSLFVEIVVVDYGRLAPGAGRFLAERAIGLHWQLSTNFHMLLPFVRLSPSAKIK